MSQSRSQSLVSVPVRAFKRTPDLGFLRTNPGVILVEVVSALMLVTMVVYCSRGAIVRWQRSQKGPMLTDEVVLDEDELDAVRKPNRGRVQSYVYENI